MSNLKPFLHVEVQELDGLGNSTERMVYIVIRSFSQDSGCYLGLREIGRRAGCSKDTVSQKIESLIEKGRIEKIGETKTLGGTTNVYKVSGEQTLNLSDEQTLNPKASDLHSKASNLHPEVSDHQTKASTLSDIELKEIKRIKENEFGNSRATPEPLSNNDPISEEALSDFRDYFERKFLS